MFLVAITLATSRSTGVQVGGMVTKQSQFKQTDEYLIFHLS